MTVSTMFMILTFVFILVAIALVLIILVQRPSGGGLAGAFGGAGGGGTDTVFGGRVGDALTWATVCAFVLYMLLAVALNRVETKPGGPRGAEQTSVTAPAPGQEETAGEAGEEQVDEDSAGEPAVVEEAGVGEAGGVGSDAGAGEGPDEEGGGSPDESDEQADQSESAETGG